MAASRDAQMHPVAVADNGVQAQPAVARMPFPSVLMIADARDHFPGLAAIAASEEPRRFDAAPQILPAVASFHRPDISESAPIIFGKGRGGLGLFEALAEMRR